MGDQQPPAEQPTTDGPGYNPDQPLKTFIDNIGIQVALYSNARDGYFETIAKSFVELDWSPDVDGIMRLRQELKEPWKRAITESWQLSRRKLQVLRKALYESKSNLVRGVMTELTDDLLEEMADNGRETRPKRKIDKMEGARINKIRDDSHDQVNWLRLRNCIDISQIRVPGQSDLKEQVERAALHELLELSLLAAKKHSELFIEINDTASVMGSDTHREAFSAAKEKATKLIDELNVTLGENLVELICDRPEDLEEVHEALGNTFVAVVQAFAAVEARWAVFYHPTSMGRTKGHGVLEMAEDLKQDKRPLNTRLRAAGALVVALRPSEKWNLLHDLRELAHLVASEAPTLGSHVGAESLHRQIRSSEYTAASDKEDEKLEKTAPRTVCEPINYYAHPPAYTRVNGQTEAPLAGPLDKNQPLKELTEAIRGHWSTRPVREALVTINAATLLVETMRTLPDVRPTSNKKQKANRDKNIPAIHQRFLQQCTLANADDYTVAAAKEVTYIRNNHWKHEVKDKVEEIGAEDDERDMDIFLDWLDAYKPSGKKEDVICHCGIKFKVGKSPSTAVIGHLKARHTKTGTPDGKVDAAADPRRNQESNNSARLYNPYSRPPWQKKITQQNQDKQSATPETKGQKRQRSGSGQTAGYNRRPDHDDRQRRLDREARKDHEDREDQRVRESKKGRKDREGRRGQEDRGDPRVARSRRERGGRSDSDYSTSPRPWK